MNSMSFSECWQILSKILAEIPTKLSFAFFFCLIGFQLNHIEKLQWQVLDHCCNTSMQC